MTEAVNPPWWSVPDVVESRDDGEDVELRKTEGRKQTDKGSVGAGGRCSYFTLQNAKRRRATATTRLRFAPLSGIGPNSLRFSDGKGLHLKFFRRKLAGLAQRTIDLLAGRYHHCTLL